ncbi:MAG TPA: MauE/DoxX family redox-associated membrane protein [Tepidisphaeraceae bacterium]|nr:MauE/DoxX family redox-associated membrane protein [Tepidisphaeraceae bacterium]
MTRSQATLLTRMGGHAGRNMPVLYGCLRYLLCAALLTAAALKGRAVVSVLSAQHAISWGDVSSGLIALAEATVALWGLLGIHARAWWWTAVFSFGGFAAVSAFHVIAGSASCGCFGGLAVDPKLTLAFDLFAVAALLSAVRIAPREPLLLWGSLPFGLAATICSGWFAFALLAAPLLAGWTDVQTVNADGKGRLPPEQWVGRRFPLIPAIDIGAELATGKWIAVLYKSHCAACITELRQYEMLAREMEANPAAPRIALIEVPPYAQATDSAVPKDTRCVAARLVDPDAWEHPTPTAFLIKDGTVSYMAARTRR